MFVVSYTANCSKTEYYTGTTWDYSITNAERFSTLEKARLFVDEVKSSVVPGEGNFFILRIC